MVIPFATGCDRLRPLGSISAPCGDPQCPDWIVSLLALTVGGIGVTAMMPMSVFEGSVVLYPTPRRQTLVGPLRRERRPYTYASCAVTLTRYGTPIRRMTLAGAIFGGGKLVRQGDGRSPMEALTTNTLLERVDELIQPPSERPLFWGNPLLSVTPASMAIRDVAMRTVALETAVREIAGEVQRLLDEA